MNERLWTGFEELVDGGEVGRRGRGVRNERGAGSRRPWSRQPSRRTGARLTLPRWSSTRVRMPSRGFLEFFAGRIANARTRAAYVGAVGQVLGVVRGARSRPRGGVPAHEEGVPKSPSAVSRRRNGATARSTVRRLTSIDSSRSGSWRTTSALPRCRKNRSFSHAS